MPIYGYTRVSTNDQTLVAQEQELRAHGCDQIYTDIVSGVKAARPSLKALFDALRPGDVLVIARLDRLGRSLQDLIHLVVKLDHHKVALRSLSETMDTNTAAGRSIFPLFAAISECERQLITERTRLGLEAAKANGRLLGRPRSLSPSALAQGRRWLQEGTLNHGQIAGALGVSESTWKRAIGRLKGDAETREEVAP